jgi:hypothetical protein
MSHYDYGFELPDVRRTYITAEDKAVTIRIVRHWYMPEDEDEADFRVSFDIAVDNIVTMRLPIGTHEDQADRIAHELYVEDEEATKEINDSIRCQRMEQRMGC